MVINMAHVLIVIGSRREGNSYILGNKLKDALDKVRISSDIIVPGNQKIYLCTGCMDCDKNGVCDYKDDMNDNINKILDASYIVFITPTRWNTLSGDLKIMMDRLNPLYSNKKLYGKKMIGLVVGSKEKSLYSTDGALTSLGLFADASGMDMVYKKMFNSCLDFKDILKQEEELQKCIDEIIKIVS